MVQGPATPIATASQRARYRIGFLVPLLEGIGSVAAAVAPVVSTIATTVGEVTTIGRVFGGGRPSPSGAATNLATLRGAKYGLVQDLPHTSQYMALAGDGALEPPAGQRRYDLGYPRGSLPPTNVPYTGFGSGGGRGLGGVSTMSIMPYGDGGAMPIVKSVLKWLRSLAFRFGADIAQGAWQQIQDLVAQGHSETTAMEIIRDDYRSGGQRAPTGKRRRMNPYNRRALRRAIRRVRSARRGLSKIRGLNRPVIHVGRPRRHRRTRGDLPLYAAEDANDYQDELEDLDGIEEEMAYE